ncbi:MAG TPA: hypothetical protein VJP80_06165 [Candidatus Saccharimonadales bacterium]|nr:hypothetical protein [Candidatus Saccharimonadales bacterium]
MSLGTHSKQRLGALLGSVFIAACTLLSSGASAASSSAIAQGFQADTGRGTIVSGALVSFKTGSHSVELAATDNASRLAGVADQSALITLSDGSKEVHVILNGTTSALVSDINGAIHSGDRIAASPIEGVGMLASSGSRIVGVAKASFDTATAQTETIDDSHGASHTVHVGAVPLQVGLAYYQSSASNFLPPFIQNLANSVAGRQVSLLRIVFCTLLLLVSFVSLSILIYSTARSAMVSLGRNPLASHEIRKGLYQVGLVTVGVWGGALLACFLILRL